MTYILQDHTCQVSQSTKLQINKVTMDVLRSTKGKDKVAFHGYVYRLDHRSQSRIPLPLTDNIVLRWIFVQEAAHYTCGPQGSQHLPRRTWWSLSRSSQHFSWGRKGRGAMLQQAGTTHNPPHRILQDNVATVPQEATAVIGNGMNIKRALSQRHATEHDDHPPLPRNTADIVLTARTSSSTTQALETPTASLSSGWGTVSRSSATTTSGIVTARSRWHRRPSRRSTRSMPSSTVLLCPVCMSSCNAKMRARILSDAAIHCWGCTDAWISPWPCDSPGLIWISSKECHSKPLGLGQERKIRKKPSFS